MVTTDICPDPGKRHSVNRRQEVFLVPAFPHHVPRFRINYKLKVLCKLGNTHQRTPLCRLQGVKKSSFSGWVTPPTNAHSHKTTSWNLTPDWTACHRSCIWLVRWQLLSERWPITSWCVDRAEQLSVFPLVYLIFNSYLVNVNEINHIILWK